MRLRRKVRPGHTTHTHTHWKCLLLNIYYCSLRWPKCGQTSTCNVDWGFCCHKPSSCTVHNKIFVCLRNLMILTDDSQISCRSDGIGVLGGSDLALKLGVVLQRCVLNAQIEHSIATIANHAVARITGNLFRESFKKEKLSIKWNLLTICNQHT